MKNNFLTIPDAPNYEINSDFVVRNKKTGKILKPYQQKSGCRAVVLYNNNSRITRAVKVLRKQALLVSKWANSTFYPVHSLGGKVEINSKGFLRYVKSKLPVKLNKKTKRYQVYLSDGKKGSASPNIIYNEVFGTSRGHPPIPVVMSKGYTVKYFDNMTKAAKFLSPILIRPFDTVYDWFINRKTFIHGWTVNYLI